MMIVVVTTGRNVFLFCTLTNQPISFKMASTNTLSAPVFISVIKIATIQVRKKN